MGSSRLFYPIIVLAAALFIPMFILQSIGIWDFWWWMTSNLLILISLSLSTDQQFRELISRDFQHSVPKKLAWGILSAIVLYFIFMAGNYLVRQMLDFAGSDISNVYNFKGEASRLRIGLLMLLVIGPGEELFWRVYAQDNFARRLGKWKGFALATLLYTAIHIPTGNLILILAALAGGLFWGWMFLKFQSATINIVSHIAWDISVFLLFPFH